MHALDRQAGGGQPLAEAAHHRFEVVAGERGLRQPVGDAVEQDRGNVGHRFSSAQPCATRCLRSSRTDRCETTEDERRRRMTQWVQSLPVTQLPWPDEPRTSPTHQVGCLGTSVNHRSNQSVRITCLELAGRHGVAAGGAVDEMHVVARVIGDGTMQVISAEFWRCRP